MKRFVVGVAFGVGALVLSGCNETYPSDSCVIQDDPGVEIDLDFGSTKTKTVQAPPPPKPPVVPKPQPPKPAAPPVVKAPPMRSGK